MNIKDIAKLAGVGVSTVSRVLNNHPDVKASTREKVLKIVEESNYIPNSSARILKQNNTKNIGILVKGMFNPFFSEMVNTIGCKINESGYTMILKQSYIEDYKDIDVLKAFINDKRLQGVICLGGNFIDINEQYIKDIEVPIVLTSVNNYNEEFTDGYSCISIDNRKAAYEATEFLLKNGHENIALMVADSYSKEGLNERRLDGFKQALKKYNIEFDECNLLEGHYRSDISYTKTKELLQRYENITAIFATSDIMAIGCAKAIVDSGKEIGKNICLIGFDGMDISEFYNPPISTIKQPKELMSNSSIELLLDLMNNKSEHKHIVLDTELIVRESCKIRIK
ncbi:LacI family transcriptional regulator [Romboutsia weinsteinii]|uniref:LacI family transcriptional regulator n=1 Tax=Romboutsia weinsteinii TaxID=2020949 RepID=A0A371J283_9FIRM|nr:LacI family DNA-binding transcriptional regulator [Romboutsia weinsteinii]RDY26922.1 LacI family transcriptional regulator [Romboutsia weinsteinii]